MSSIKKWPVRLFLSVCALIWVVSIVTVFYVRLHTEDLNPGVRLVKLMYDFTTPIELANNQAVVQEVLSADDWERLQIDDRSRAINGYYKFYYSESHVKIEDYCDGYVLYTLRNGHIDPKQYWVLEYNIDEFSGKLCDIKEYKLVETMKGGFKD